MRSTIAEVARLAGVSKTTVSFAFNAPARISPATRAKIMRIAEEIGYVADPVARTLARRRIGSLGLLLPQSVAEVFKNPYLGELLQGIGEVCQRKDLAVSLLPPVAGTVSQAIRAAMVDALVLLGIGLERGIGRLLGHRRMPFVTIDGEPVAGVPNVGIDDEGAAFALMEHVLGLGHRRVEIFGLHSVPHTLSDAGGSRTGERRLMGFRRALSAHGLRPGRNGVRAHTVEGSIRASSGLARRILDVERPPTAIVCMSDVAALGVYDACRHLGLAIPGDLSVAGFDDLPLASLLTPALTTMRQPGIEKGRRAAELAVMLLGGSRTASVTLGATLVVRSSTAGPRT